jgi:hypothetical protein
MQSFYAQHSPITQPKQYAHLYEAVPDSISEIGTLVRGLVMHYFAEGITPEPTRLAQVDSRLVPVMLENLLQQNNAPLTTPRPTEQKLVGCCRDFTVLTVSILRQKGIPARARYGTATYFEDGYYIDHVVVEYWNGERWVMADMQLRTEHDWGFDTLDIPPGKFFTGGQGWQMARSGTVPANKFGLGSIMKVEPWGFLMAELLLDLAALNRIEMLCWDAWGLAAKDIGELSEADKQLLDEVAAATVDNNQFERWQQLYEQPQLKLTPNLLSFSPALPQIPTPITVHLEG